MALDVQAARLAADPLDVVRLPCRPAPLHHPREIANGRAEYDTDRAAGEEELVLGETVLDLVGVLGELAERQPQDALDRGALAPAVGIRQHQVEMHVDRERGRSTMLGQLSLRVANLAH